MAHKTAVLGLGNSLLGDEGVGVHAVRALQQKSLPDGVEIADIGTAILDALPLLEECDRVIVIDAVKAGEKPGTLYCMPLSAMSEKECIASLHGVDLHRVMRLSRRSSPPDILVIGIEPDRIDWSLELSPSVNAALPMLLQLVSDAIVH
ncbi:MAG: hydrogenase maturation protease [Acidobacteriota bacterium]|nr:hydrogenase maturation protease [Acidobacteriota bacterium]